MKRIPMLLAMSVLLAIPVSGQVGTTETPGNYTAGVAFWGGSDSRTGSATMRAELDISGSFTITRQVTDPTTQNGYRTELAELAYRVNAEAGAFPGGPTVAAEIYRAEMDPLPSGWQPLQPRMPLSVTAAATYRIRSVYIGPLVSPPVSYVPYLLDYCGESSGPGSGSLRVFGSALVNLTIPLAGPYRAGIAVLALPPNVTHTAILEARMVFHLNPGTSTVGSVVVDPVFRIDPNFPYADQFITVVSPEVIQSTEGRNTAPDANAGPDQTMDEHTLVTLDGTASADAENQSLSYAWTQIAGTPVALSDPSVARPSFVAPLTLLGGETLSFQLVVHDGRFASEPDVVEITVKNVNHVPIAEAGPDQSVQEGSSVTLDGSASYDEDAESLSFCWLQIDGLPVALSDSSTPSPDFAAPLVGNTGAVLTFALVVSDGIDSSGVDLVHVVVTNLNGAPVAAAGAPQTVDEGTLVQLDGRESSDPDGDALSYAWTQLAGPLVLLMDPESPMPSFVAPDVSGSVELLFELVVRDTESAASMPAAQTTVTVRDLNAPPSCASARPSVSELWPPNHRFQPVSILGVTDPNDQEIQIEITGVSQDEPTSGLGDGDTECDAVIQGSTVLLRAERSGTGNGRAYYVSYRASDGVAACTGVVRVEVRRDKSRAAVAEGPLYDSTR